jgi:lipoprotein-releasing system permease protein
MRLSLWLAAKHLARSRRGGFLGRVSMLALLGVGIGVATLLTVFAFVQGFQAEVLDLLTGMNPAVFISSSTRGGLGSDSPAHELVAKVDGVVASSPFIQQKGVLSLRESKSLELAGVILRGLDPRLEPAVTSILDRCEPPFTGFAFPGAAGILLGSRLAEELGVLPGETLTFTTLLDDAGGQAIHHEFMVLGTVKTGLHEFDRRFAYMDLSEASRLFRDGSGFDGLGLKLSEVGRADQVTEILRSQLDYAAFRVASWHDLNGEIFRWISTMRSVLFLALSLIILVAGFNVAGTMTIIVTEKTREIGLLLALGASRLSILGIFLLEGWIIGAAGVLGGGLLGSGLILWFASHPLPLPGEVYFIDSLPARLSPSLYLSIAGAAVLVAFLALVLPGLEALRRQPLESLQGEGGIRA